MFHILVQCHEINVARLTLENNAKFIEIAAPTISVVQRRRAPPPGSRRRWGRGCERRVATGPQKRTPAMRPDGPRAETNTSRAAESTTSRSRVY